MVKLQIIPFKASHLREVKPDIAEPMVDVAQYAETCGWSYTACVCGIKVGCAGIMIERNGIGQLWAVFSPLIKGMRFQLFKECRRLLLENLREHRSEIDCLYALVDIGDEQAERFVKHLHKAFHVKRMMYELLIRDLDGDGMPAGRDLRDRNRDRRARNDRGIGGDVGRRRDSVEPSAKAEQAERPGRRRASDGNGASRGGSHAAD